VDIVIVYSETYEEHFGQLLGKLTMAGFAINIDKCEVCKQEIKFFGHFVSDRQVKVCNQKELRQFLGTCNYHHRFTLN
jgi:hypothetical protein